MDSIVASLTNMFDPARGMSLKLPIQGLRHLTTLKELRHSLEWLLLSWNRQQLAGLMVNILLLFRRSLT